MFKKIIIGLIGIVSLVLSSVASAVWIDPYNSYPDRRFMPPPEIVEVYQPGFYIGIQGAFVSLNFQNQDVLFAPFGGPFFAAQDLSESKAAGRVFFGYDFSSYFAGELGYTYFGRQSFNYFVPAIVSVNSRTLTTRFMQQGVDLVAKGMWPIGVFTPYIKAGGQWINRGSLNFENFILNDASILNLQTNTFAFIAGLGVDVEVFTNFKIGLGYTRTFGDSAGNTRPIDFVSLGITYRFNTPEPGEYPYDRRPNRKY